MLSAYFALKNYEPELNIKEYRNSDIYKIFKRDRVYFTQDFISVLGYYEVDDRGREAVVVNSSLRGTELTRTLCHETVHHYIDHPVTDEVVKLCRTMEPIQRRQDASAEMLSLIMVFPFPILETFILTGELPEHLYPYLQERLYILNYYGV